MQFQKTVLIIALVVLVISVIIIAAILDQAEGKKKWPPEEGSCPPYYKLGTSIKDDPSSIACIQQDPERLIGRAKDDRENCATFKLINENGKPKTRADKKAWVERCKVKWDGYN